MKPILSIIIATKNRQKYCLSAIESILSLQDTDFELVIQDNSDENSLETTLVRYSADKRLKYRYTSIPYSFIDNFNASIELSSGIFLCLIGDDDGINPELIKVAKWANENDIDAVTGSLSANYRWAGTGAPDTLFTKMTDSTLTITNFNGKAEYVNIDESLKMLMKNGATNYTEFKFPKLYHGLIKRSFFEEVKAKTGKYINGLSPDIYSSISLACTLDKLIYIDYPITIPGVCAESGSIKEGQKKENSKKLEDAPHLKNREDYIWSKEVPRVYCVQTIWADSCIAALKDMGRIDYLKYFDKYMLYANMIDADKSLKEILYSNEIKLISEKFQLYIKYLKGPIVKFIKFRALGRIKKILKIERFENKLELQDMVQATNYLSKYLSKLNINVISSLNKVKSK